MRLMRSLLVENMRTYRLLIPGECLSESKIELKSGLAGAVLLKFSNYRIQVKGVLVQAEMIGVGKFYEFVLETNRGNEFRASRTRNKALEWLISQ